MHYFSTRNSRQGWQKKGHQETGYRINRKRVAAPRLTIGKARIPLVCSAKNVIGSHQSKKHPHTKQSKPGEELNDRQLFHCPGHLTHGAGDRKSTRLNSSHVAISYAVFCLK